MTIGISPVVLSLGPWALRWFGLLALVGLATGVGLALRAAPAWGLRRGLLLNLLPWVVPFGIICARLTNVLSWWDAYLTHPAELWQLNLGDLSLWGGLLGGGAMALARLGRDRGDLRRRVFEALVPAVPLAIAIGRLGEFLDGHGVGLPSNLPWATVYTNPLAATPDFGVPRHPAQLYDGLAVLLIGLLAWRLPAGLRAPTFLVGYGLARIGLGGLELEPTFLFGIQLQQFLAAVAVLVGLWSGMHRRPLVAQTPRPVPHHDQESLAA